MPDYITHALSIAIDAKDPPKELRLFREGVNHSLKGSFLFDAKAAADVMANYAAMGHSLTIDYDHGSVRKDSVDPSKSGKSAGRFDLELRGGELWATNIRWAPAAEEAIRREEWPFISPAFHSGEDGRVSLVLNFGLTGNPALLDPARLIAAGAATDTNTAPEDQRTETNAQRDTKAPLARSEIKTMKWNALNDYMQKMGCAKPMMASALGLTVEALDAFMRGDEEMSADQEMNMKKCPMGQMMAAPVAASMGDAVNLAALNVLAGRPGANLQDTLARVGELQTAGVQLLSVTRAASLTDAIKRVEVLSAFVGDLVKASGVADEAGAVTKIRDLCGKQSEIEEGARKAKESRVAHALSVAKDANKIVPAEVDGLKLMGMKDEAWLVDHLSKRAAITALSADEVHEGNVDTGVTLGATVAGLVEKDGIVTLNGLPYEKLGGDVKHNLAASDVVADKKAFKALRANWEKRGAPIASA